MKSKQALGQAIKVAIEKKIQKGDVRFKSEIARDFGVTPSSLTDWEQKGSISKDKIFKLFEYFSDVVPQEHWFEDWEIKDESYLRAMIFSRNLHENQRKNPDGSPSDKSEREIFLEVHSQLAPKQIDEIVTTENRQINTNTRDFPGTVEIPYIEAKDFPRGGSIPRSKEAFKKFYKEESWLLKHNLKPEFLLVLLADDNSMADFIVNGDAVIFDTLKKEPKSGHIYLIQHPDGLKIKQLRREIDGTWILECRNPDKRRFPDERIPQDKPELLNIIGEFVYRQGGI